MVANPDRDAMMLKGILRVFGTIFGCIIGYQIALHTEGNTAVQAIVIAAVTGCGVLMRFRSKYAYAWLLGTLTLNMAVIGAILDPATLNDFVVNRGIEIVVGVGAAFFAAVVLGRDVHGPPVAPAAVGSKLEAGEVAIIGALAPVVALYAWSLFDLPSLLQIVVSAVVLLDRDLAATRARGLQRLFGCIGGGGIGLAVVGSGLGNGFVPWTVLLVGGLVLFAHLHHGTGRWTYVGTQGGFGYITAMITENGAPNSIEPIVERLEGIIIGVLIVTALVAVLAPFFLHRAAARRAG
jgi:uncharacterized membrane protein YccC